MDMQTLQAEVREGRGKGPARQLRQKGLIPAVYYGPGVDTTAVAVSPKELGRALNTPHRRNTILKLSIGATGDQKESYALVRDVQVHPISREPVHADFYRIELEKPVEVLVPLEATGRAIGVQEGGRLKVIFRMLPVRCLPEKIPVLIKVDVSHLKINQGIAKAELPIPEGVEVLLGPKESVVVVLGADKEEEVAEVAAVAAAPGEQPAEGAAGAAATPAEGAAAAAKPDAKAEGKGKGKDKK